MDAGVVSGLLQLATQGRLFRREDFSLRSRCEQKASRRKRLRRRGAICGVAAPPRCAPASPSSRLLASDPAALATPPTPFFSNLLGKGGTDPAPTESSGRVPPPRPRGWLVLRRELRAAPPGARRPRPRLGAPVCRPATGAVGRPRHRQTPPGHRGGGWRRRAPRGHGRPSRRRRRASFRRPS